MRCSNSRASSTSCSRAYSSATCGKRGAGGIRGVQPPQCASMLTMPSVLLAALFVLTGSTASAQIDLTGSWASRLHEDYIERGPGSDLGDFSGLPLSDEGRTR